MNLFKASRERKETYFRMMTLPLAVAVILSSSSMINWATTLSSKNRPSGSFFPTAYQVPAYCEKEITRISQYIHVLHEGQNIFTIEIEILELQWWCLEKLKQKNK